MKAVAKTLYPAKGQRLIAISDIHGNLEVFQKLLEKINFTEKDMLIIAGTSLQVYPAANFIYDFCGEHLVVVNKEELKVQLNDDSDLFICESMGNVFAEIEKML